MRFLRRSLIGLFLVSLTVGLLSAAGYRFYSAFQERAEQSGFTPPARERQFAVNVTRVEVGALTPVLSTFGEVRARRTLELRVPTGGEIVMLSDAFEEGGAVKEGDVLLKVDPTDAESALRVAQADLQEALAELSDAERGLEISEDDLDAARAQLDLRSAALTRQRNLADRGVGTESAVETAALSEAAARQSVLSKRQSLASATARVDQGKNAVLRAEIALSEAERALENTTVTAAFDGTLSDVSGALGAIINANEKIGSLIDPTDLEVSFRVSTEQYARMAGTASALPALPVTAALDVAGVDLTATGRISRESAAVGEGQTGRLLFARLETALGLRAGDFVTVRIEEPELTGVARLPSSAVDAAQTVLALDEDSRLEVLDAPVLRRQGDDVIVDAALIAGRLVVTERSPVLGAGIRVRAIGAEQETQNTPNGGSTSGAQSEGEAATTVSLSDERRAKLIEFVEANTRMPAEARERIKSQLNADAVPADLVARLESRMGS